MNTDVMFSNKSDEWETPQNLFDELNAEFMFQLDAAATAENYKCGLYLTFALDRSWDYGSIWCNPPYSKCAAFVAKAAKESAQGKTVVMLLPARTDTKWFHAFIWNRATHRPYDGVEVRFLKGRLKFGHSRNSAPFPSMIVIFLGAK